MKRNKVTRLLAMGLIMILMLSDFMGLPCVWGALFSWEIFHWACE